MLAEYFVVFMLLFAAAGMITALIRAPLSKFEKVANTLTAIVLIVMAVYLANVMGITS